MEEKGLKDLKRQIKLEFEAIKDEKATFDQTRSNVTKMTIATNAEKLMVKSDKSMKDFQFQLNMFRGDEVANF